MFSIRKSRKFRLIPSVSRDAEFPEQLLFWSWLGFCGWLSKCQPMNHERRRCPSGEECWSAHYQGNGGFPLRRGLAFSIEVLADEFH